MEWKLEGTSIPSPADVGSVLRVSAPELCKGFDTLMAFQKYVWNEKSLKKVKVHPRQEMFARLCNGSPPEKMRGNILQSPSFTLHIDPAMPEYEMHLIYNNNKCEIIRLD